MTPLLLAGITVVSVEQAVAVPFATRHPVFRERERWRDVDTPAAR